MFPWRKLRLVSSTGTIADPGGAVVANDPLRLKNSETGALFEAASTATGNFTFVQLPAGRYQFIPWPVFK